jgi:predicted transposase YdaD
MVKKSGKIDIVKKMLKNNYKIEQIIEITELTKEEILKIQNENT